MKIIKENTSFMEVNIKMPHNKIKQLIKNPYILFNYLGSKHLLNWVPDKIYLQLQFRARMNKKLNLKNPQTFNEKLQWLKLYDRDPKYIKLTDKLEVRKYINEKIGDKYLIPILGVYNDFDEIDFDQLPNQFVLKCTHDSGGVVICKDKSQFDIKKAKNKINKHFNRNYYYGKREWPYKFINPKIICEKYMVDDSGTELKDFKFMCFNGEPKCLLVASNRNRPGGLKIDFYDMEWNLLPFERHYPRSGIEIPKPKSFDEMVILARKLSENIPFVRVDFYEVNGQPYFGELTFYPGSGYLEFTPEKFDYLLGSWLELPKSLKG